MMDGREACLRTSNNRRVIACQQQYSRFEPLILIIFNGFLPELLVHGLMTSQK